LVEVNQKIPDRDEAPLRPAVHGGEPSAVSRVFDKRPRFAGLALDTAPGSRGRGVSKIAERVLDNADDLIHGARTPSSRNGASFLPISKWNDASFLSSMLSSTTGMSAAGYTCRSTDHVP